MAWPDRLISATKRRLRPLKEEDARDLIRNPQPGFPDIYPPGGVDEIVRRTACQAYLVVQLVCDRLCLVLNEEGRLKATDKDLELAFVDAFEEESLFHQLWAQQNDEDREVLRAAAREPRIELERSESLVHLRNEEYVRQDESGGVHVVIPMFREWILRNG